MMKVPKDSRKLLIIPSILFFVLDICLKRSLSIPENVDCSEELFDWGCMLSYCMKFYV